MQRKKVLILGAGISGLSTAWYLSRSSIPLEITILEKTMRAGGWLHTEQADGFHFEKGPRTFQARRSPALLQLIQELSLSSEIITSSLRKQSRYIWLDQKLRRLPSNPLSLLFSPLTKGVVPALLSEWKKPVKQGDETVWEFISRRFNPDVARLLFDPLVVGIFGGDARAISVKACFPQLKNWEEEAGSVTKGFWRARQAGKRSSTVPSLPPKSIFSLRQGMEQLIRSLLEQTPAEIHYGQEVQSIQCEEGRVKVTTSQGSFVADSLFCALPLQPAARLLVPHMPESAREWTQIPSAGMAVVSCGYEDAVLPVEGFGYLAPTSAQEEILGALFDSSVFSQHNRKPKETRLTVLLKETGRKESAYIEAAKEGIRRQLGIAAAPQAISVKCASEAIPQYAPYHLEKMQAFLEKAREEMPGCYWAGNYLAGVSVDQCIQRAKAAVDEFLVAAAAAY